MKKSTYILLLVFSLMFASCESELDLPSQASINAESNTTVKDVDAMVIGIYNKMIKVTDYEFMNHMFPMLLADNLNGISVAWFQIDNAMKHEVPSGDILLNYMYYPQYEAINRCNNVIKQEIATPAQKSAAYYCRALCHLRLYDVFGAVPFINEDYVIDTPIAPLADAQLLEAIAGDLRFASEHGADFDTSDRAESYSGVTKYAAKALLARVYRLQGKIADAGKLAEEVITSGKFDLASNPAENLGEMIFQFTGTKKDGSYMGALLSSSTYGWNCFSAADDLVALIQGDDTRSVIFKKETIGDTEYTFPSKYTTNDDSNIIISRLSEMYLISAEAGNANRLTEFQAVRKSSLSLENERRLELCFESGIRWEDIKLSGKDNYTLPYPDAATSSNSLLRRP